MQALLAIGISIVIGSGFQTVGFDPKSPKYSSLCVLGAKLLLAGVHPVFFRLGPFTNLVLWLSRILKSLAVGCFLVGFGTAALQYKRQWKCRAVPQSPSKSESKALVKPEELASRIAPYDNVYDVTDAMNRVFRRGQAGAIVTDASTERSITVEFNWRRPGVANGVDIEFSASATEEEAINFTLFDPAKYQHIVLERGLFRDLLLFLHQHARETNEVSSGRRLYRGILP